MIGWGAWGRTAEDYEEARRVILRELAKGSTLGEATKAAGVSRDACWRWRKDYPAFSEAVTEILERNEVEREIARQERRERKSTHSPFTGGDAMESYA